MTYVLGDGKSRPGAIRPHRIGARRPGFGAAGRSLPALGASEAHYRILFDANPCPMWVYDIDTLEFLAVNDAAVMHYGYSRAEFLRLTIRDIRPPEELDSLHNGQPGLPRLLQKSGPWKHRKRDRSEIYVEINSHELPFADRPARLVLIHDITEQTEAETALRRAEEKYRNIFENAVEGIFQTTPDGRYLSVNPALARIYGYSSPAELANGVTDIAHQLYVDPTRRSEFARRLQEQDRVVGFEARIRRKDGSVVWISENARAVRDAEGTLLYYEGMVEDITQRKLAQEQLLHDACHDKLTGLANRALLMDRLQHLIERSRRSRGLFAVLFLDFDRFKVVNDSLGHAVGDQLLVAASHRLRSSIRPSDTVARLGGDEFVILLEHIDEEAEALQVAARLQKEFTLPFDLGGQEVFTSASIGIAVSSTGYDLAEDLLRDADMAMYRAKAQGPGHHALSVPDMHLDAVARLQLETDLRWAIERGELCAHYQPIIALKTGRIAGFEALVRWRHPERGLIFPGEFMSVAEETGLVVPLGKRVLMDACAQMGKWHAEFPELPDLTMSVNVSGRQFSQPNLMEQIRSVLAESRLDPSRLKIEITESAIMENAAAAAAMLREARALGIRKSLDDFGTGYSSLSYLHRLPIDTLKIDRSFVSMIDAPGSSLEIVRTIVDLGHNLGKDIVAEGVQTDEQLAVLQNLGCDYGQGFYFSPPLDEEAATTLLRQSPRW